MSASTRVIQTTRVACDATGCTAKETLFGNDAVVRDTLNKNAGWRCSSAHRTDLCPVHADSPAHFVTQ